jgi:hypothetical protein
MSLVQRLNIPYLLWVGDSMELGDNDTTEIVFERGKR